MSLYFCRQAVFYKPIEVITEKLYNVPFSLFLSSEVANICSNLVLFFAFDFIFCNKPWQFVQNEFLLLFSVCFECVCQL